MVDPLAEARVVADLESALLGRPRAAIWLSRYLLVERVGVGGSGVVYSAYDPQLERKVAVKLLQRPRDRTLEPTTRLRAEARAMARLSHPNVVPIYDVGTYRLSELPLEPGHNGQGVFVVMELVDGADLAQWLQRKPRSRAAVLDLLLQAGEGLWAAHTQGIVHRDFKPGNVVVDANGRPKVTDFGLASTGGGRSTPPREHAADAPADRAAPRRGGTVSGTPKYMPPEQHLGAPAQAQTDQYSFFVTVYEALTGMPPFHGDTMDALLAAKRRGLTSDSAQRLPRSLRAVIKRGLHPDPRRRFGSMRDAIAAIAAARRRTRRGLAVAGLGAAAVAAGALGTWDGPAEVRPCDTSPQSIASLWDPSTRDEVGAAFATTKISYADHAWRAVERRLGAYVTSWSQARDAVCRATAERGEPAEVVRRRLACLEDARTAVEELVAVLRRPNATIVEGGVSAALSLPDPQACSSALPDAVVADDVSRTEAAAVRATLVRARTQYAAGAIRVAFDMAASARRDAQQLGRLDVEAYAAIEQAAIGAAAGYDVRQILTDAVVLAEELGHDALVDRALIGLIDAERVAYRFDVADRYARQARARLSHRRADPTTHTGFLSVFGGLRAAQGRFDEAVPLLRDALTERQQTAGAEHPSVADAWHALGDALTQQGEHREASRAHYAALQIRQRAFGRDHPIVADSLASLSHAAIVGASYDDALRHGLAAVDVLERALGDDDVRLVKALGAVATARYHRSQFVEALALRRRILAILDAAGGNEHPSGAAAQTNLAAVLFVLDRRDESVDAFQRALDILEATLGPTHPWLVSPLCGKAFVLARNGQAVAAEQIAARALNIAETSYGAEHPMVGYPLTVLGEAMLRQGRPAAALPHLRRAQTVRRAQVLDPANRAEMEFALARALWLTGEAPARVTPLANRARARFATVGIRSDEELTAVDSFLRRVSAQIR